jgi:putative membrane protein
MSDSGFEAPRRQEPFGVIILFGQNVRKLINILAALVFGSSVTDQFSIGLVPAVAVSATIMAIYTILQYLRFQFRIEGDELVLDRGVLKREHLRIPFERIQTVHVSQNIIQQIFQLSGLKIDTAGSSKQELKISALKSKEAQELKEILQNKGTVTSSEQEGATTILETNDTVDELLVKLSIMRLLLVGLTQNHVKNGLVAIAFIYGWGNQIGDRFFGGVAKQIESRAESLSDIESLMQSSVLFVVTLIAMFLIASVLVSIIRTVLRHFDLEAVLKNDNIKVTAGLLKRNEYSIPLKKIQIMSWQSNFLRRIPGFESVLIKQSKSDDSSRKLNVEIPACYPPQTDKLEEALFSSSTDLPMVSLKPHPFYLKFLIAKNFLIGLIPIVILAIAQQNYLLAGLLIPYLLIVILCSKKYYDRAELSSNGQLIQRKKGWLFTDRSLVKAYKVQSVKMRQSIFQKRRGTAHINLHTAGGTIVMRFMRQSDVQQLYNHLLYKVETSKESWM